MAYIQQIINGLKKDKVFNDEMNKQMGFIPNEVEGIGEMATYLESERHLEIINEALSENGITNSDGFMGVIYGSIGSSSSQILIPRSIDKPSLTFQCLETFTLYHSDMEITESDVNDMYECIQINIKNNEWTIILVSNNALFDKYIPLYILTELHKITQLPIAISNAIAHSFYAKSKTFLDTMPELLKRTASLDELFNNDTVNERLNNDMMPSSQFIVKYRNDVFDHCYDGGQSLAVSLAYKNIIMIPKTKEEGTFINNSWDKSIWFPKKVGGLSIDGYIPVLDIGGGRTNEAYALNNIPLMTKNILKEMKSTYPTGECFPICSGKIRTTIEKTMICSSGNNMVRLIPFEVVPTYCEYFESSTYVTMKNGRMCVYLYVI